MGVVCFMCRYRWVAGAQGLGAAHRRDKVLLSKPNGIQKSHTVSKVVYKCAAFRAASPLRRCEFGVLGRVFEALTRSHYTSTFTRLHGSYCYATTTNVYSLSLVPAWLLAWCQPWHWRFHGMNSVADATVAEPRRSHSNDLEAGRSGVTFGPDVSRPAVSYFTWSQTPYTTSPHSGAVSSTRHAMV